MNTETSNETPTPPRQCRTRWRMAISCVVILVCGALIGSVVTSVYYHHGHMPMMHSPERLPEHIARNMQKKYKLVDKQEQQLETIFKEHTKKIMEIRSEIAPRMEAEHEALQRSVEGVLTPQQAEQWRKEFDRMRRLWRLPVNPPRTTDSAQPSNP